MSVWLEIIIPVRNPGSKLLESGASLVAQTERGFGVVISDNFSTSGTEFIAKFCEQLQAAGIPVHLVKPPRELGRVQHWNWAHAQAGAEWLKPLFVGDLLKPAYVETVRRRVEARPDAQIVCCKFESKSATRTERSFVPFTQDSLTATEFLDYIIARGNWLGGPVNLAYRRSAYQAVGGYPTQIPAVADYKLHNVRPCVMASRSSMTIWRFSNFTTSGFPLASGAGGSMAVSSCG